MADLPVVAAGQFPSRPGDTVGNLGRATETVETAADLGAALVVLPEYSLSGYDREWVAAGAPGGGVTPDDQTFAALSALSAERSLTLVVNDLERSGDRLHSTSFVLSHGTLVGRHRKTILTEGEEGAGLVAGDHPADLVTVPDLPVALAPMVCFEHGFPEIALDLALRGTGVIAISSAIRTGTEYLRNLRTRSRAQDNGCYVVAANSVGHGYCGESMIADPRGDVVARASATDADVVVAELDPALIDKQRRREPVLRLRRPELFDRS